jgi:maltase-glucoamylase
MLKLRKIIAMLIMFSCPPEYAFAKGPMLTWRTVGGVLDFFVFMGPTPENVVQQYTAVKLLLLHY